MASRALDTSDLRAVVELRKKEPLKSVRSLIRRVIDSKSKKQYIAEFVVRECLTEQRILELLSHYVAKSDIISIEVAGSLGRLVLSANGKAGLQLASRKLHVPLRSVLSRILYS